MWFSARCSDHVCVFCNVTQGKGFNVLLLTHGSNVHGMHGEATRLTGLGTLQADQAHVRAPVYEGHVTQV